MATKSGTVLEASATTGGAGDEIGLQKFNGLRQYDDSDPDKITSLGHELEDVSLDEAKEQGDVYKACSVNNSNDGLPQKRQMTQNVDQARHQGQDIHVHDKSYGNETAPSSPSSWSVTKVFRSRFFRCCGKIEGEGDENSESGIELENLCTTRTNRPDMENVDEVDGVEALKESVLIGTQDSSYYPIACSKGPTMTIDCSTIAVEDELRRIRASLGDVIRKLIIRNSPVKAATKILDEPLINENVTSLQIENCDISVRDLCLMLGNLKCIEILNIEIRTGSRNSSLLKEDFHNSRGIKEYFRDLRSQYFPSKDSRPKNLRILTLDLPLTWQCSLICGAVEAFVDKNQLQEINVKSSLKKMIYYLVSTENVRFEDAVSWQNLVTLDAGELIQKCSSSLNHLSISCADTFPLEYLSLSKTLGIPVDDIFKWSFFCTWGLIKSIVSSDDGTDANKNIQLLPKLKNLTLDLPLVPIPMARDDDFRKPLNALAEFFARNNSIHVVTLNGLRPVKGMENWIKNSLVTIPKYRMSVGCTYTSTTLASNLPFFDDELGSLGLEIVQDDTRQRVGEIIDPNGLEVIPHGWRYTGMKCFHLVNQLSSLKSYDLDRIASKFSKLTKLTIEDYALVYGTSTKPYDGTTSPTSARSIGDLDMQTIFQKLICLEYLHLDCNMNNMTDRGLTGMTDSLWTRLTKREKNLSFWYLVNLKYIFLRGLGEQVTDKSAVYAFSEEFSLKKLRELHVFAPGFTNYGREKIRRAFEARIGFILQL